ncbi:MAG: glucose-1-phosphate cytidylyltransferase [Lachnospiraceae bacterium]|nr:glucose-1-phosphate cytidylyltransferase [Lachnospiraceae bacterium]MDY4096684.1 glucose-1-phosphate cytidylyltransferase [Lachnospiraceae bacterium]
MKVVILAGGKGTRISEESYLRPKPMIQIGDMPILWHIMKIYSFYGYNEFIICCGYKGYVIKEFFADYFLHMSDITFDFSNDNKVIIHNNVAEPWKVTCIDTGKETMTGGRIKKIQPYIPEGENFMLTYGDGVSDVNIHKLIECHKINNKIVTVTAVQPNGKFGMLNILDNGTVTEFLEKPQGDGGWINGGFMVLDHQVFDYLVDDEELIFEEKPLAQLASEGQLNAYKHSGFWKPMDTIRDKEQLNAMWKKNEAPWKIWT